MKGLSKDITERWFGQHEFNTKEKDTEGDEFADQFPLPRDALLKTKAHEKRVKMLKLQAKQLERENRVLEKLREEHRVGDI